MKKQINKYLTDHFHGGLKISSTSIKNVRGVRKNIARWRLGKEIYVISVPVQTMCNARETQGDFLMPFLSRLPCKVGQSHLKIITYTLLISITPKQSEFWEVKPITSKSNQRE